MRRLIYLSVVVLACGAAIVEAQDQIFLDGRKHPVDPSPTWCG